MITVSLPLSSYHRSQEIWLIISLLFLAIMGGWITTYWLVFLLLGLSVYLGWHLYNAYRLLQWFFYPKKIILPEAVGIWGEIFNHCYHWQQRNRKRKRKLSTMLKRVRRFTAAMPDASVILSAEQEIEWFNKASRKLLGFRSPQDLGQPIINLIRYPNFHHYLNHYQTQDSVKLVSPINPNMMLRINVVPYAGHRYLLLARDVTQLHRLEQVRRDFVANVSHELRTPLTVIAGFLETMSDSDDEPLKNWQRPLFLMNQQVSRMRSIVEDLLLLSRLESEYYQTTTEPVIVAELLEEIYYDAEALDQDNKYIFILQLDQELVLEGNAEELRSAFSNLVFNAVRYTPEGGEITLRCYQDERGAHVAISDTGEGIASEHIPRLTERFYRVDVGRSRNQGGTGLGLAIVKHVLNRHNAQLHIESTVGKGSLFRCDFPTQSICKSESSEF
jgi:two-component system, OmpR family, phosphate regulon sensor histidine kinase PhoR